MGLKKEKGRSIDEEVLDDGDHWAFLEEIEAPMWVDLTKEATCSGIVSDAAWFGVSHQIHQMSSRLLKKSIQSFGKEENGLPNLGCSSPEVPDSVSRSRGKDYKSRKWLGQLHDTLDIKHHPVRKLGAVSIGEVRKKAVDKNSSSSTVTLCSSSRRPRKCVYDYQNSFLQSNAKTEESSSRSVISKCQNLGPNSSVTGPRKTSTKRGTSQFASKMYEEVQIPSLIGSKNAICSTRKTVRGEHFLQSHQFSAGKSSVGSSCSVGSILENGNTTKMLKNERVKGIKVASVSAANLPKTKTKNTTQQYQNRAGGTKIVCRETKTKVLGPTAPRKPLAQVNGLRQQGNAVVTKPRVVVGAVKKNLKSVRDKENATEEKLQCPKQKQVLGPTALRKPLAQLNGSRQQGNNVITKSRIVAGAVKKHFKSVEGKENTTKEKLQCPK